MSRPGARVRPAPSFPSPFLAATVAPAAKPARTPPSTPPSTGPSKALPGGTSKPSSAPPATAPRPRRPVVARPPDLAPDAAADEAAATAALTAFLDATMGGGEAPGLAPVVAVGAALRRARSLASVDPSLLASVANRLIAAAEAGKSIIIPDGAPSSSPDALAALAAVAASTALLRAASTPGCPPAARSEDALAVALDAVRRQALANALAPVDARLAASHRPGGVGRTAPDAGSPASKKAKGKGKASTPSAGGAAGDEVRAALEAALPAAAAALAAVRPPDGPVLALARAAAAALVVDAGPAVAAGAADFLAAAYRAAPALRPALLDALLTDALPHHVATSRGPGRAARGGVPAAPGVVVSPLAAAILRVVHAAADLPTATASDAPPALIGAYAPALAAADVIAAGLLDRVAAAKAVKADTDVDAKAAVDDVVADLAACVGLPAWPAAGPVLLRVAGAAAGERGARSGDAGTRVAAVDIVGAAAVALCAMVATAEAEAGEAAALVAALAPGAPGAALPGLGADAALAATYLSTGPADAADAGASRSSARRFLLARALAEWAAGPGAGADAGEVAAAAAAYRDAASTLDAGLVADLSPADGALLARSVAAAGGEARARGTLLAALADAADPARQAPAARARALRALAAVARADPRTARSPELQAAVGRALRDEAASARQAALDVVGAAIELEPGLALPFFDVLVAASRDAAPSVRKAALKLVDERCVRDASFPRGADAAVALMAAAADAEEGVSDAAARSLGDLWFGGGRPASAAGATPAHAPPPDRAVRLAAAASAMAAAAGGGLRLPLDAAHPFVASIKAALDAPGGGGGLASPRGARPPTPGGAPPAPRGADVVSALLDSAVADLGGAAGSAAGGGALLALHALTAAAPALAAPAGDPAALVRCLAPYVKPPPARSAGAPAPPPGADRAAADRLVATLCVLATALASPRAARAAAGPVAADLARDLTSLINAHAYIQVVAAACRALASLAVPRSPAERALGYWSARYLAELSPPPNAPPKPASGFAARFLFVLGHLFRHGAPAIERAPPPADGTPPATAAACLDAALAHFEDSGADAKTREAALHALGCLAVASPAAALGRRARRALRAALSPAAPAAFKLRALHNLTELLRSEDARLVDAQAASRDRAALGGAPLAAATPQGAAGPGGAVPTACGVGDSLSLASGVLQEGWEWVLRLALDPAPVPPAPTAAGARDPRHAAVRRAAVALMDAVDRGGLVAPWTAVPTLVASSTDPAADVAARALRVLARAAARAPDMFKATLADGLPLAASFHAALGDAFGGEEGQGQGGAASRSGAADVARGVAALYSTLIRPAKPLRAAFLGRLLKRVDAACDVHARGGEEADVG